MTKTTTKRITRSGKVMIDASGSTSAGSLKSLRGTKRILKTLTSKGKVVKKIGKSVLGLMDNGVVVEKLQKGKKTIA